MSPTRDDVNVDFRKKSKTFHVLSVFFCFCFCDRDKISTFAMFICNVHFAKCHVKWTF